eukprot:350794-Chlamydomonas_euryale.AAC.5
MPPTPSAVHAPMSSYADTHHHHHDKQTADTSVPDYYHAHDMRWYQWSGHVWTYHHPDHV